jgi:hypothetical protein
MDVSHGFWLKAKLTGIILFEFGLQPKRDAHLHPGALPQATMKMAFGQTVQHPQESWPLY